MSLPTSFLLEHRDEEWLMDAYPLSMSEAIALIGLLLRRRSNNFKIIKHLNPKGFTITQNYRHRSFFRDACIETLIPSANSIMLDPKSNALQNALISKMAGVLQCRDHIHEQILRNQTGDSVETAGFYFECYLTLLRSAFDMSARLVDLVYRPLQVGQKRFNKLEIGWNHDKWYAAVCNKSPIIEQHMPQKSFQRDIFNCIKFLRDHYVHAGESRVLEHLDTSNGRRFRSPLLVIPPDKSNKIQKILGRLFGNKCVIHPFPPKGIFLLEIGQTIELLTPCAFKIFEDLFFILQKDGQTQGCNKSLKESQDPLSQCFTQNKAEDLRKFIGIDVCHAK